MKKPLLPSESAASRRTELCLTAALLAGLVLPAAAQLPNPNQAPPGAMRPQVTAAPVPTVVPAAPSLSPNAGPTIVSLTPARNQRNAPVAGGVAVTFSEALTNNAATLGALRVFSPHRGGRLSGQASVSGNTLTFAPNVNFRPGETVSATVTTAVQGATGNLVQPQVFQFIGAAAGGTANLSALAATPEVAGGSQNFNLAVGDLDGDGDLDIAAPQFGLASISIRLNNGLNTTNFVTPASNSQVAVGGAARTVVLGDIDADGDLDLVATQNFSGTTVSVRLNNGSGAFSAPAVGAEVAVGSYPLAAALNDIDGDGDLDLLVTNNGSNSVSVRFNNGAGVFTAPATNGEVAVAIYPLGMAMADADNDGDLDLFTPSYGSSANGTTVSLRLNDGSGVFTAPAVGSQITVGTGPVQIAVGDLDGDDDVDLISGNYTSNTVSVRLNNGTGVFVAPAAGAEITVATQPENVALADLDGDGDLDILSADQGSNVVSIRLNNGAGVFTAPTTNSQISVGYNPSGLAVGDLDGDGDVDFATGNYGGSTISVRLNQGTPAAQTNLVVSTAQNVSGSYNNVTITGTGAATLNGTLTVSGTLTVQSGGKLATNCQLLTGTGNFSLNAGGTLIICDAAGITLSGATGAVRLSGTRTFSSDASYVYSGTTAQVTGNGLPSQVRNLTSTNANDVTLSAPTSVAQVLTLSSSGNLQLNGQRLTLLSGATGTALLVNAGTGTVVGATGALQRYIDGSGNPAGAGYRLYSAPVTGSTVADLTTTGFTPVLNSAYNSAATPATVTPYPTVFGYDQSRLNNTATGISVFDKGFYSPAATSDALTPGRGFMVNISNAALVDFVGSFNQGNFSLSNLTRSAPIPAAGATDQTGWHLVGNPYPAPLDWNTVTDAARPNVDAAAYVYQSTGLNSGVFRSFVNGIGAGAGLIAAGQGFFVRASTAGATGSVNLTNSNRVTSFGTQATFQRTTATQPLVQLTLSNAAALTDDVFVYTETGATTGFDGHFDAYKLPNTTGLNVAALSSLSEPLSVQGLAPITTTATVVPLQVSVPAAGTFSLRAAQLANLPAGTYAYLRDLQAGAAIDLAQQPAYSFTLSAAGPIANRFELVLTPTRITALAPAALSQQVLVYPNPARSAVTVELPAALRPQAHTLTLRNALGQQVRTAELPAGPATRSLPLTGLSAGVYTLSLTTPQGVVVRRLVVE
ncbi:FG-GAP-like repeat-containing protein [Hymenobacter sp. 15J16-1T3B]|uniref:FG-GAP-like repeat-containing protein n=1 Tax=Hymenobacter sp. 15J16-1T3B TaxID=2886941 RepID=UPI001D1185BB|nr:FG-GAP-like repeat-containing protein [Hymenobacter sp. 15J16-1T3B]MCC3159807.1 FG-GAP-like repeat-containing protein [Hymenobacter sp. 15J16-1T3B]